MKSFIGILFITLSMLPSLSTAEVVIGSESWLQPQTLRVQLTNEGRYLMRFCHDFEGTRCRSIGRDPRGFTKAQIVRLNEKLDQKSRSLGRNRTVLFSLAIVATMTSGAMPFWLGGTTLISSSQLMSSLLSDPLNQPAYYQMIKNELIDKSGVYYTPNIEELAKTLFTYLSDIGDYEVSCLCQDNKGRLTNEIVGIGKKGHYAARMNAQHLCRKWVSDHTGEYSARTTVSNCATKNQPALDGLQCSSEEMCF